jgi:hypothetical protein
MLLINFRCDSNIWDEYFSTLIYVATDIMLSANPTKIR